MSMSSGDKAKKQCQHSANHSSMMRRVLELCT